MSFLSFLRRLSESTKSEATTCSSDGSEQDRGDHSPKMKEEKKEDGKDCLLGVHAYDDPKPEQYSLSKYVAWEEGAVFATERQTRRCKRCGNVDVRYRSYILRIGRWKSNPFSKE